MLPELPTLDRYASYYAQMTPVAEAAVQCDMRWDFAMLEAKVNGLAHWLSAQGITRGDRVAVAAGPGLIYYVALLATVRLGGIYVGINPRYTVAEITHVVALTAPKLCLVDVVSDSGFADRLAEAAPAMTVKACKTPMELPCIEGPPLSSAARPMDEAVIVFTSGSTGKPKGAALHHAGLIAAALAQHQLSDIWDDGAQPRLLSNLPVNHVGGIMNLTLAGLVGGGTLVFQSKFDPEDTLHLLQHERITTWLQVPAMFTLCVSFEGFSPEVLQDLRTIGIGGGPVSAKTLVHLRKTGADIFVEYGQTETMSSLTWSDKTDPDDVLLNTVGRFDPGIETRIADEAGRLVSTGEIGEVQARGNCVLRRYWADERATADAFTPDGWLKTGDLAMQRTDGRIVLKGRAREMIKSGGYNVYPREVEMVIENDPTVAEVVVFGVPDEVYVERVEAAIEPCNSSSPPDLKVLEARCREVLAGYKLPRRFHIRDALPRLPNGKIDRAAIRGVTA